MPLLLPILDGAVLKLNCASRVIFVNCNCKNCIILTILWTRIGSGPSLTYFPVCIENFFKTIFGPNAPHLHPHSRLPTQFIKASPHSQFLEVHLLRCLFDGRRSPAFSEDSIMHIRRPSRPHYWSIHQTFICCRPSRTSIAAMPPAFLHRRDLPEGRTGNPKP